MQNRITAIEGLDAFRCLKNLELGANRIRVIENLDSLHALEELWLGKNKITELKVRARVDRRGRAASRGILTR